jgi:predicted metal-dependent peptidase
MVNNARSLAKITKELMLEEPFYGLFLVGLNKEWRTDLSTAGVSKKNINAQLAINPDFWNSIPDEHKHGLIKHELLHIAFNHLTTRDAYPDKKLFNIAADLEINQYIRAHRLPEGGITMASFPDMTLPVRAGTQKYYEILSEKNEEPRKPDGSGNSIQEMMDGQPDDMHGTWSDFDDLPEAEKKLIQKQIEHQLKEVATQVSSKNAGSIPGELKDIIDNLFSDPEPPKFDWKGYLRKFVANSSIVYTKKSRRKYNKRYYGNPGLKIKQRNHVLVAIDTSGSVSNKELTEFLKEIAHIHKSGNEITLIECDTQINSVKKFKPSETYEVHGRGGTSFQPVIDHFNDNPRKYTSIIYFTDGEARSPKDVKCKILWAHSSQSNINEDLPGFKIKLN